MINHSEIITSLEKNREIFESMLSGIPEEQYRWKPAPGKWNLLEVVCHLFDEERDDFRARLDHTLHTPDLPLPLTDPETWVISRNYAQQDYDKMLAAFLEERRRTVSWLRSLDTPDWKRTYLHPKVGPLPAELFLSNWLAHDYLHMRQIVSLDYHYLTANFESRYDYAGVW